MPAVPKCVAVILPRVQDEFQISDNWIGMLSSSIFTGMMIGAWSWGSYSDSFGRVGAFKGTLLLTSIFGILAGFSTSFTMLCFSFFGLGLGVGGSMPTDGTIFLENLPEEYHYLLTGLSVFFSLGAILTSSIALYIIPRHSCPEDEPQGKCNFAEQNQGWRYLMSILAIITVIFFLCRLLFFRLHESPKYLVTAGQDQEAVDVLQYISDHNGSAFNFQLADVEDGAQNKSSIRLTSSAYQRLESGETEETDPQRADAKRQISESDVAVLPETGQGWRRTLQDYSDRISALLEPRLRKTTLIVWILWFSVSAAYTIFNVFLPRFLEEKLGKTPGGDSRTESLQEYCIYTLAGLPGSLVGAGLEKHMGKKQAMALSTLATSLGILAFAFMSSQTGTMLVSVWISFQGTLMYAIIYGYTPRLFPVAHRGTATGIASALSRLAGMTAPIATGVLLTISTSLPLYISSSLFFASAVLMALLR